VSRSLGHHGARSVGVVPDPEVKEVQLTVHDQFVILGSDGLWTFVSPQEAVELVAFEMAVAAESIGGGGGSSGSGSSGGFGGGPARSQNVRGHGGADRAAERLVELACQRWRDEEDDYRDDVSVVVVALPVSATQADMQAAVAKKATTKERKDLLRTQQRASSKDQAAAADEDEEP
jgi:serine/threonine protein phosphatase PrpC